MEDEYDPDALRREYEATLRAEYGEYDPVEERIAEVEEAKQAFRNMSRVFENVGKAVRETMEPAMRQMSEAIAERFKDFKFPIPTDPSAPLPGSLYGRAELNMPTMSPLEVAAEKYMKGIKGRFSPLANGSMPGSLFINGRHAGSAEVSFDEGGDSGPKHEGGDAESGD